MTLWVLWLFFFFCKTPRTVATKHWGSRGTVRIFPACRVENRGALRETERSALTPLPGRPGPRRHSLPLPRCRSCFSQHVPSAYRSHPPRPEAGQPPASEERGISRDNPSRRSLRSLGHSPPLPRRQRKPQEIARTPRLGLGTSTVGFGRALTAEPIKRFVNHHHDSARERTEETLNTA